MCTHSCLLYSFPLVLFGDTLLLLSSRRHGGVHPELPGVRRLLGVRLPVDLPVAPSFRASYLFLRIRCIRHFVIHVINNFRTLFIISFMWYMLWYTIHSIVYTCDLILARIWLLGLCPFVNRVLQYFDGSVMKTGAGAGLLFISPLGDHIRYVIRLYFPVSMLTLLSAPDIYTASARFRVAFPSEYSPKVYQSTEPKRQETIY